VRIHSTIDRLTESQWKFANQVLRTGYDIPADADRVCLVVEHRGEERHVETPVGVLASLVLSLNLPVVINGGATATAALTPDELPDHLEKVRNAADPARRPVLPTAAQVRDLTAAEAVALAEEMNRS
jgi:hypothetical protein